MRTPFSIRTLRAGSVALVVDGEVAPLAEDGAVVDQGDERARDQLADLAGVDRGVLDDVVGFEAVATGLVEEDAAAAAGQDDGDLARGRWSGVELGQGPGGRRSGRSPRRRSARRSRSLRCGRAISYPVCIPVSPLATQTTEKRVRTWSSWATGPRSWR